MNIVSAIFERCSGSAPALIHPSGSLSYHQLQRRVIKAAESLLRHPFWPKTRVPRAALLHPSGPDYIIAALAVLQAGGCFVPVPEELTGPERDQLLAITAADVLIAAKQENWRPADAAGRDEVSGAGMGLSIERLDHRSAPVFPVAELETMEPAFVRFSSGTTGLAKGVVLSHETLRARIAAANEALAIGPGDRVLWMLPMAHHFAVSIVLYLYHGAATILASPSHAADLLQLASNHQASVIYGSPYHYAMLAAEDGPALDSLRLAVSTAFALPETTAQLFAARFGVALQQGLGIIEAGLPLLNADAARSKPCAIGKPLPAFAAKLVDSRGCEIHNGEVGELWLRGPGMLDAYLAPWQPRDVILKNGWFATGDIVMRDAEGCYHWRGRTRTVINVGGLKCFPEEVEAVLREHPAIAAARVMGRPHPALGAAPVAEIVLRDGGAPPSMLELRRHCQLQLAAYKVPIGFQRVPALPMTSSGKILRAAIRGPLDTL